MKFSSTRHALAVFLEIAQLRQAPSAARLTVSLGRSYAESCGRCGHTGHQRGRESVERCSRCGAAWRTEDVELVRGQIQLSRRPHAGDGRLLDLVTLSTLFGRVPAWPRRALLLADGIGLPHRLTAEEIPKRWPRAPHPMTVDVVRRLVREGRDDFERRLRRAGLLAS